eukprot:8387047-Alexandrium_andersonii.AAC.1
MVTSCREGEVFGWADSPRHLLRGARDGLRRQDHRGTTSDSEDEEAPPRGLPSGPRSDRRG